MSDKKTKKKQLIRTSYKEIFCPKKEGLTGKNKPLAFIILSHWDKEDKATDFKGTRKLLEKSIGYAVVNHKLRTSTFFEEWQIELKHQHKGKKLVVWVLAHGAPGFFFGEKATRKDEKFFAKHFAQKIMDEAKKANLIMKAVVLDSCFSANETRSLCKRRYLKSPARMLSEYLEGLPIYGALGKSSTIKVEILNDKGESKKIAPAQGGFLCFLNGKTQIYKKKEIYFLTDYLQNHYAETLGYKENSLPSYLKQKTPGNSPTRKSNLKIN